MQITSDLAIGRYGSRSAGFGVQQSGTLTTFRNVLPQRTRPGTDVPRMIEPPIPLRVVIQQLGVYPVPNYRVIAYGDDLKPMHGDFGSAALLVEGLRSAIPGFDVTQLSLQPLLEGHGSIVFDGEMLLSSEQRSALGLK